VLPRWIAVDEPFPGDGPRVCGAEFRAFETPRLFVVAPVRNRGTASVSLGVQRINLRLFMRPMVGHYKGVISMMLDGACCGSNCQTQNPRSYRTTPRYLHVFFGRYFPSAILEDTAVDPQSNVEFISDLSEWHAGRITFDEVKARALARDKDKS
jgi:hypothetical protein